MGRQAVKLCDACELLKAQAKVKGKLGFCLCSLCKWRRGLLGLLEQLDDLESCAPEWAASALDDLHDCVDDLQRMTEARG